MTGTHLGRDDDDGLPPLVIRVTAAERRWWRERYSEEQIRVLGSWLESWLEVEDRSRPARRKSTGVGQD